MDVKNSYIISQSEAPAPEEIQVRKHQRYTASYTSSLSSSTGETCLTGEIRVKCNSREMHSKK